MYRYENEKPHLFTEDGQRLFLGIRDRAFHLCKMAGAARMQEIMAGSTGSSWHMLACVDRLVEIEELVEITDPAKAKGQCRIFVRPYDC